VIIRENLLDLSRNVYLFRYHLRFLDPCKTRQLYARMGL